MARLVAVGSLAVWLTVSSSSQTYTWCVQCYQEVACEVLGPYFSSSFTACGSRRIDYMGGQPDDCELWTRKQRTCLQPYKAVRWENYVELKVNYTCFETGGCHPN